MSEQHDDLGEAAMNDSSPPPEPFLLLLPAEILGFGFHDKKWSKRKTPFHMMKSPLDSS